MKKIVIAGVTGFIGSSLCNKFLEMGYQVIGIGRSDDTLGRVHQNSNYIFMKQDQIDYNLLKDADIFYQLAWNMGLYNTKDNILACDTELENVKLSYGIMDIAIKANAKKFVFIGSISQEMYYFDENRELTNVKGRIYGLGKEFASNLCQKLAYDANIEYNLAILANTYGPNDYNNKAVSQFINKMVQNEDLNLISEKDLADWVYIDDTVEGLIYIGEKGINMKSYYLGHREIKTFGEYMRALKETLHSTSKLNFDVYEEKLGYDYSKVDLEALYQDTGFSCHADFDESILKTEKWLRKKR